MSRKRRREMSAQERQSILSDYDNGMTVADIERKYDRWSSAIYFLLKKEGRHARTKSTSKQTRTGRNRSKATPKTSTALVVHSTRHQVVKTAEKAQRALSHANKATNSISSTLSRLATHFTQHNVGAKNLFIDFEKRTYVLTRFEAGEFS